MFLPLSSESRMTADQIRELFNELGGFAIENAKVLEIIKSMREQFLAKNRLSEKQTDLLQKFAKQFNPETVKQRSEWEASWNAEKAELFKKMIGYYKMNPPFYEQLVKTYEANPNMIPPQSVYEKMSGNKFVQAFFRKTSVQSRFQVGDMVKLIRAGILEGYRGSVYGLDTTDPMHIYCNVMEVNVDAKGYCYTLRSIGGKMITVHEIGISKRKVDEKAILGED